MKPETLGYISSSKSTRIHAFNEALSRVVKGGSLDHVDILFDYGMLHMHSMRPNAGLGFAADQQKIFYIKQGRLA